MDSQFLPWRSSPRIRLLIIFGAYLLITGLITWPVIGRLGSEIPDLLGDGYVHLWTFDWLKDSLLSETNPFFTSRLFFPIGASLANHNIAWFHFLIWLPLQAITGGSAAFSLVFLLNYALNALAVFLLVRRVTGSDAAAFIGGLVAGFWPYNISHHSHPNLIAIWWIPLILMAIEDLVAHRQYRNAILVGVLVGLLGITRWQLLILSGILLGMALIFYLAQVPPRHWRRILFLLLISGFIAATLMAPFILPVLEYQITRDNPEELLLNDEEAYGTDLATYLLPSRYHPLWGPAVTRVIYRFYGNAAYVRFIGFVPLLLAIIGAISQWRKSLLWTTSTVVYFLLSLGSTLYILGKPYGTMPYKLLEDSFTFQLIRFPDRFNVVLAIPVAVLVGLGVAWLVNRSKLWLAYAVPVLCTALIFFEYMVIYPMLPLTVPPWHSALTESETIGLLDVPMCPQSNFNKRYMFYQLQHEKPLVQGHISRPSQEMFAFINSVPLLKEINCQLDAPITVTNVSEQLRLLASADIPYLVLHKEYLKPERLNSWREWLVSAPHFEDSQLIVYKTTPSPNDSIPWSQPMLADDSGVTVLGLVGSKNINESLERIQGDWLVTEVTWQATVSPAHDLLACVDLVHVDGESAQNDCYPLSDDWPAAKWQDGEIVHEGYPLQIDPFLPPGEYKVSLSLRDAIKDEPLGQSARVGNLIVKALSRDFTPSVNSVSDIATWADRITLVGYNYVEETEMPRIELHWRAEQRMASSYKFFLHVTDRSSGELIFQEDRVPGNWEYPTNWWEADEYVSEFIELPISSASLSNYDVWIGWYDPDTGERLPITGALNDQQISENRLLLTR